MADPVWTDVVALVQPTQADGTSVFTDLSSYANSVTRSSSNVTVSTTRTKFSPSSARFATNAGSDELIVNSIAAEFGSSANSTFDTWVYFDVVGTASQFLCTGPFNAWMANGELKMQAASATITSSGAGIVAGAWNYLRFVKSGTTGTIWVGGASKGSGTIGANSSNSALSFGGPNNEAGGSFMYLGAARFARTAWENVAHSAPTAIFPSFAASAGASAGAATVSAAGRSLGIGAGAATGTGTVSGVAGSQAATTGASNGVGAATGIGKSDAAADGAATATGQAAGVGVGAGVGDGSAAGLGDASGIGQSRAIAAGAASGLGQAAGAGASNGRGSGVSSATGTAVAVGESFVLTIGSATGTATALGDGIGPGIGSAAGVGSASAVGKSTAASTGFAAGTSQVLGIYRIDAARPISAHPVHFYQAIGPNNKARHAQRGRGQVRFGYPVLLRVDP